MKKKIALLLAAAMTISALPMTAFASSTNSVNKVASVKEDDEIRSSGNLLVLKVQPKDEIVTGDTIVIDIDNGEFDRSLIDEAQYPYWDEIQSLYASGATLDYIYNKYLYQNNCAELPYLINYVSKSEIEVKLFPVVESLTDTTSYTNNQAVGKMVYNISLPAVATDEGDVKISVDSNDTSVSDSSSITIARTSAGSGSTTASVSSSEVKSTSADSFEFATVTIKEDTSGTFKDGTIKVKVNGKFEWGKDLPVLMPGVNCTSSFPSGGISGTLTNDSTIEYKIYASYFDSEKLSSVKFGGDYNGTISCDDSDKDYGDVTVSVSGSSAGVSSQTITVATRQDYGFSLESLESAPTIFAGRSPIDVYGEANDLDEDDFKTAKFRFTETTPDTWLTSRKIEFSVPAGVKIIGAEVDKTKYMGMTEDDLQGLMSIVSNGSTLRIDALDNFNKDTLNDTENSYFDMYLYVTTEATFTGDITVTASGAGLDADTLSPITVATVQAPVTVDTSATKTNLGYQAVDTADITITETAPGAFMEDEYVVIKMDTVYGDQELGFASDNAELTVTGDLSVKEFKVTSGEMRFKVDGESYSEPASITISNVKVGTTRSIPYGTYDLLVGGAALVNNYDEYASQKSKADVSNGLKPTELGKVNDDFGVFDTEEGFKYKGYLEVKTETGTLDGKVSVTIGSSILNLNGEEVDMGEGIEPYIDPATDSTLVPLRFVALAIGVDPDSLSDAQNSSKVIWDANTKTASILYAAGNGMKIVKFQANSDVMNIDGTDVSMVNEQYSPVYAQIKNDRMFVPFRALGQALGVTVTWDAETRTAHYNG